MPRWSEATLEDRLLRKTCKLSCGCWLWTGYLTPDGYGRIQVNHRSRETHRVSYELFRGGIPHGMQIDHTCSTRSCVNPEHLTVVSKEENLRLTVARGRLANQRKTSCKRGHPLSGDNLYVYNDGRRMCRTCHRRLMMENGHYKGTQASVSSI